jgi:hypothetical protein
VWIIDRTSEGSRDTQQTSYFTQRNRCPYVINPCSRKLLDIDFSESIGENNYMSNSGEKILEQLRVCARAGQLRCSSHGYDELTADRLYFDEVVSGLFDAVVVEAYPDYPKGPSLLLLQRDPDGSPIHAVWGIPKGHDCLSVLVTAYRPDPDRWDETYTRRK